MKTAGQILKLTRIGKKLELVEASRTTKIRPQFLSSIEADDYSHLPSGATARGFIRNYSEYLGLNPEYVLAIFRRDFLENQSGQIVPRGVAEPVSRRYVWTPKMTVIALVVLVFTVLGGYLAYQYQILTGPPILTVTTPKENISTDQDTIEVSGVTDPQATISINGEMVALDKGGTFSVRIPIKPGDNKISVTSTGKSGLTTTIDRGVKLTPAP